MGDEDHGPEAEGVVFRARCDMIGLHPIIVLQHVGRSAMWGDTFAVEELDDLIGVLERLANECRRAGIKTRLTGTYLYPG